MFGVWRCAQIDPSGAHGVVLNREVAPAEMAGSSHPFDEVERAAAHPPGVEPAEPAEHAEHAESDGGGGSGGGDSGGGGRGGGGNDGGDSGGGGGGGGGGVLAVRWRLGGPVCGGRLGVVSYTLLHTHSAVAPTVRRSDVPPPVASIEVVAAPAASAAPSASTVPDRSTAAPMRQQSGAAADNDALGEEVGSAEGAGAPPPPPCAAIRAASAFGRPASLSPDALVAAIRTLSAAASTQPPSAAASNATSAVHSSPRVGGRAEAIVCIGHCSWGRGQLQAELDRGSWQLYEAHAEDVTHPNGAGDLWERLRSRERPRVPHVAANESAPESE